jgi:O-antigen ligase
VPEYLKALIVILGLAITTFWLAREQACVISMPTKEYANRRNLWLALTLGAFLAQNFWVFSVFSCLVVYYVATKTENSMALFLFVLFAVPPIANTLPGIGGVQQIFSVSHSRILAVIVLLPAFIRLRNLTDSEKFGTSWTDRLLLGYLVLPLILQISVDSWTNTVRYGLYSITDVFLPYYVASRGIKTIAAWRDTIMSFILAVTILSVVAIFEYIRHWLLYSTIPSQLGVDWDFGGYMLRAESVRALASAGHAIVLGYILMVGLAFYICSQSLIPNKKFRMLGFAIISAALLATAARGPWVGAVAVGVVLLLTGQKRASRAMQLIVAVTVMVGLLMMTTWGSEFLSYLPFVGTTESESVIYRQRLFDVSVQVIALNPVFGSFDYLRNPLMMQMVQGEGIIDLVNSYLGIALTYGLLGLTLFSGVFITGGYRVLKTMKLTNPGDELNTLARAILAALIGVLITIATASSVSFIALLYWILAGFCMAYSKSVDASTTAHLSHARIFDSSLKNRYIAEGILH